MCLLEYCKDDVDGCIYTYVGQYTTQECIDENCDVPIGPEMPEGGWYRYNLTSNVCVEL